MRSELREFNEGEMQAFDDLIAVLIVHDAVVVNEIRSIMRKDIIYQVERIHRLEFTVFSSLFSLTHIELGCIEQYSLLESVGPMNLHSRQIGNSLMTGASTASALLAVRPLRANLSPTLLPDSTPK